jgi:SAM-dependent methyltransferase
MERFRPEDVSATYDAVAREYAERFVDELDGKPFDRDLLDRFAVRTAERGLVCDLGCGPGHVARYLAGRGVDVVGVDVSPAMVGVARDLNPGLRFEVGDMRALEFASVSLAGIVAFYSLIHLPRAELPDVLRELRRTLQPDGVLVVALHAGTGELHSDEWFGKPVHFGATLYVLDEIVEQVGLAGLTVEDAISRPPYEREGSTTRLYVTATAVP